MKTPDDEWWDLQSAEYVLGTLTDSERLEFEQYLDTDADLQQRVLAWQIRLDPLNLTTEPVAPPAHVLQDIHARLNTIAQPRMQRNENVIDAADVWRRKARNWQRVAVTSLVAAAAIIGALLFNPNWMPFPTQTDNIRPVAILQNDENQPIWLINYRTVRNDGATTGELLVSVVGQPKKDASQSHQLWMVLPDGAGVQSAGMIPDKRGESSIIQLPIPLMRAAELAVSIEDNGEVPGPEHGPVVARTFIIKPDTDI